MTNNTSALLKPNLRVGFDFSVDIERLATDFTGREWLFAEVYRWLFGDTPRGLAVSLDGATVYAAAFRSGNQTTVINQAAVLSGGGLPAMPPGSTPGWPDTGLIVKYNPGNDNWEDEELTDWSSDVPFDLPDLDVFIIDATKSPPDLATPPSSSRVAGVGTVIFNLAVRPNDGKVYASNLELLNHKRFVGFVGETQGLQGVAFFDTGNAFGEGDNLFDVTDWRYGTGVGVQWFSPFGPLAVILGFPLDKLSVEDSPVFEFSVGGRDF